MQTLTAGSFLNLENDSGVEALKHTARRLAEASATVVKENLTPAALENLANTLWGKAEYVTRETERRRLHQIFNENFSERFRELKPAGAAQAENSNSGFLTAASLLENPDSKEELNAPKIAESANSNSTEAAAEEDIPLTAPSKESAPETAGKTDEFLGFVESGESLKDVRGAEVNEATAVSTVLEETAPITVQNADELKTAISKPENQLAVVETPIPVSQSVVEKDETQAVNSSNEEKPEATTAAITESKPTATTAAAATSEADGREPFEFEKCRINLNLTLLPMESGSNKRKVIVSAMSHNLPPEIDFLEIGCGGADLTNIAALVSDKLARFKQTLPVKYIEQLRATKAKSAKRTAPAKTTAATAAPTKPADSQPKVEKTSGEQKMPEAKREEAVETQSEKAADKGDATISPATSRAVNQSFGANNIQGSLF